MLLLKKDTPLYENFPEHQRTHIDKTVREKDVRRTLFCPRIWSASECSYTIDNENPVENKNVGSLLFRGDTLLICQTAVAIVFFIYFLLVL